MKFQRAILLRYGGGETLHQVCPVAETLEQSILGRHVG